MVSTAFSVIRLDKDTTRLRKVFNAAISYGRKSLDPNSKEKSWTYSYVSQYVLHTHAHSRGMQYPRAAEAVDNSMYVDDLLDSSETVESTQHLQRQFSELLGTAGFSLTFLRMTGLPR